MFAAAAGASGCQLRCPCFGLGLNIPPREPCVTLPFGCHPRSQAKAGVRQGWEEHTVMQWWRVSLRGSVPFTSDPQLSPAYPTLLMTGGWEAGVGKPPPPGAALGSSSHLCPGCCATCSSPPLPKPWGILPVISPWTWLVSGGKARRPAASRSCSHTGLHSPSSNLSRWPSNGWLHCRAPG